MLLLARNLISKLFSNSELFWLVLGYDLSSHFIIGFLGYEYTSCNTFKFYLSMSLTVQVLLIYVLIYPSINYRCLIHPSFTYQCPYLLLLFLLTMSLSMFILLIHALIHSSFTYPCLYLFKFYLFMSLSIQILLIHVSIYPSFTYS